MPSVSDFRQRRPFGRWLLWAALLVCGNAVAQRSDGDGPASRADALVRQLGDASFSRREEAERHLEQLGADALPALREAAQDRDLEIRYRARRLVTRIEHQRQWRLLGTFLTNFDPELAQQLPGWTRYEEWVGSDLEARELFVAMYEAEPEIMSLVGRDAVKLSLVLEQRAAELRPDSNRHPTSMAVPPPSTAVLLFASLDPQAQVTPTSRTLMTSLVSESTFRRAATASGDPPLRRLLATWVDQAEEVAPATRMNIGVKFELPSAVVPAIELIEGRAHGSQLQYAVFTVARLGTADHIPILETLLTNRTVLSERQRGDDETFTCQVRDVALAALIHLIGKHPREFGFNELRPNSNSVYALNTAGFDSEESRQLAIRQWELWRILQRHEGRGIAEIAMEGATL